MASSIIFAVTCGVSMATSTMSAPRSACTSANAAGSRRSSPPSDCAMAVTPGGTHGEGSPSNTATVPLDRVAASTAQKVSSNAAAAMLTAWSAVSGGVSRVFTRPGTGALARTITMVIGDEVTDSGVGGPQTLSVARGRSRWASLG